MNSSLNAKMKAILWLWTMLHEERLWGAFWKFLQKQFGIFKKLKFGTRQEQHILDSSLLTFYRATSISVMPVWNTDLWTIVIDIQNSKNWSISIPDGLCRLLQSSDILMSSYDLNNTLMHLHTILTYLQGWKNQVFLGFIRSFRFFTF